MNRLLPILTLLALVACNSATDLKLEPKAELSSPDGRLRMSFYLSDEGTPRYALERAGVPVLTPGRLGFSLRGTVKAEELAYASDGSVDKLDREGVVAFDRGFELAGTATDTFDETWEPVWGEESQIRNHYN